ncbi:hypothetical protein AwWohl_03180 [Gammaproteobacteria bacterium]|nr:hypothetical protein AwWohl_03180 [Gammaproteobacteria bacterium]
MKNKINALGFIEVIGLAAAIEAADSMLKSANVRLLATHQTDPAMITVIVEGDLAACRAAIDAGVGAASRIGTVLSQKVIGRPTYDCEEMVTSLLARSNDPSWRIEMTPSKLAPPDLTQPDLTPPDLTPSDLTQPEPASVETEDLTQPDLSQPELTSPESGSIELDPKSNDKDLLDFIQESKSGLLLTEITKKFPKMNDFRKRLSRLVNTNQLVLKRNRYFTPHQE